VAVEDALERRLLMRTSADVPIADSADTYLTRPSVHDRATPPSGLRDELAEAGAYLFILSMQASEGPPVARIDLPMLSEVRYFWPRWRAWRRHRAPAVCPA